MSPHGDKNPKGPFIHIRSGSVPFWRASGQKKRGVEGLFFLPLARRNGTDPERICTNGPLFQVCVSRFFLVEGGSEMERFACATGASAQMES